MRKVFVTFMTSLLSCSAAFAFWPEAADSSFELGVGYRRDKLSWTTQVKVSEDQTPVSIASKLQWKDLNIWQIDANFKYITCDNIYFRASGDYGWITSGKVNNKDYLLVGESSSSSSSISSNSQAIEFADFSAKANKGHVYDADIAIGYQFKMCDYSLALTPVIGYSWNGQHLENGHNNSSSYDYSSTSTSIVPLVAAVDRQVVDDSSSSSDQFNGKYSARWNGPFIGLDLDYKVMCDWSLFATYEFHWARYHAKGDWGLRTDFIDGFNHRGKSAHGHVASVGVKYDFCECWTLGLVGEWTYFRANKGQNRALISDEGVSGGLEERCFLYAPLKHVTWQSASVTVNVGMLF